MASERSEPDTYRGKNEKIGDVCLLASERSERDTLRGNAIEISLYLLASERSERDTYWGNTIENRGCLFIGERAKRARQYYGWIMQNRVYVIYICMYVWMVRMLFKRARGELFSPKNTAI